MKNGGSGRCGPNHDPNPLQPRLVAVKSGKQIYQLGWFPAGGFWFGTGARTTGTG